MTLKFAESRITVFLRTNSFSRLFTNPIKNLSTYNDIPKSPQLPLVGSLPYFIKAGGQTHLHKYVDNLHKKLGPVFRDNLGGSEMLFISDPDANLQVYRSEGNYPEHYLPEAWVLYLQETGQKRGLFFMNGPEWLKCRQILNRILLRTNNMENYVQQISSVCKDFAAILKSMPENGSLEYYLYNWNIECVGAMVLGTRLGFLEKFLDKDKIDDSRAAKETEFARAIHDIFLETVNLSLLPMKWGKILKAGSWKRFCSAVSISLSEGREYVQRGIEDYSSKPSNENQGCILHRLLNEERLDNELVSNLIIDLFLASTDTTSHTARWVFYMLGKNPDIAQRTREEICSLLVPDKALTLETLNQSSYLKGIIKEVLRLFPTAPFLTRKLSKDTTLHGYYVPAGTMVISSLFTMGRNPSYFEDPNSFRPERWFRHSKNVQENCEIEVLHTNKKAYTPWGLGGRSCIGKRMAELELSLLIMEMLLAFDWTVKEDVDMILRMVSVPSKDFKLDIKPLIPNNK